MKTLGVDVSSQDRGTAICVARWDGGRCTLEDLEVGVGDARIVELMREVKTSGIDAPFGWPVRFVDAVADWSHHDRWTQDWYDEPARRELRLRATDRWVQKRTGKWPLSVSTDSIAMCALRTVGLLRDAGAPIDRVGGPHYEVYPGAALIRWGLRETATGYKKSESVRAGVVAALAPDDGWLRLTSEQRATLARTDHALDALLSALVARAATCGFTEPPPNDNGRSVIAREGWIHLPREHSLAQLPDARVSRNTT